METLQREGRILKKNEVNRAWGNTPDCQNQGLCGLSVREGLNEENLV